MQCEIMHCIVEEATESYRCAQAAPAVAANGSGGVAPAPPNSQCLDALLPPLPLLLLLQGRDCARFAEQQRRRDGAECGAAHAVGGQLATSQLAFSRDSSIFPAAVAALVCLECWDFYTARSVYTSCVSVN